MAAMEESKMELTGEEEKEVSKFELVHRATIRDNSSQVFAVRFSPDSMHIAAGGDDSSIRIFNASDGKGAHTVECGSISAMPTSCIRFRPNTSFHRTKDVFLTANTCGTVQHWHMSSNKCLHTFSDHAEQVYALDFNDTGSQFVTAGKDGKIRIYDEATKSKIVSLEGGLLGDYTREAPGHSNRVFSVKFTHDEHIILSGGWDNTVQIWDTREGCSVRSLHGPHICGDALDLKHGQILTGSWRSSDQLELWDFGSGERITEIPWTGSQQDKSCMLYAAQFSKDSVGRFIVAGGSGSNEAKVFDHLAGNAVVGTVADLPEGVFSVDIAPDGEKIAIASDTCIRILDVVKKRDYYY
jgi:WD40 repeat protein